MEEKIPLTKEEIKDIFKHKKFRGKFIDKRGDRGILVKEHTLWTKTEIAVLAYFVKNNNKPAIYREIARAYVKSNYPDFKKACESLLNKGKLERLEKGFFKIIDGKFEEIKKGKELVERPLPYFNYFLNKLKQR